MHCLMVGPEMLTRRPMLLLESADERWRCTALSREARRLPPAEVIVVFPGPRAEALLDLLVQSPPVPTPWIVCCGWQDHRCDLSLAPEHIASLPQRIAALEAAGALPRLCAPLLPALTDAARAMLHALELHPRLGAWVFLPRMVALVTLYPRLQSHVSAVLYPMLGADCGLTAAAVERRLRIAVESAWSTSPLTALERFFGQAVDPEKGKPTNREFLCQMAEHLRPQAQSLSGRTA